MDSIFHRLLPSPTVNRLRTKACRTSSFRISNSFIVRSLKVPSVHRIGLFNDQIRTKGSIASDRTDAKRLCNHPSRLGPKWHDDRVPADVSLLCFIILHRATLAPPRSAAGHVNRRTSVGSEMPERPDGLTLPLQNSTSVTKTKDVIENRQDAGRAIHVVSNVTQ
jgi:hypothetical protein